MGRGLIMEWLLLANLLLILSISVCSAGMATYVNSTNVLSDTWDTRLSCIEGCDGASCDQKLCCNRIRWKDCPWGFGKGLECLTEKDDVYSGVCVAERYCRCGLRWKK